MCNAWHGIEGGGSKIKKEGVAWRIFGPGDRPPFRRSSEGRYIEKYRKGRDGRVKWDERETGWDFKQLGFAVFLTKKEAKRLLDELNKPFEGSYGFSECYIKKVEYRGGIGKHIEERITHKDTFEIGIVREFKII